MRTSFLSLAFSLLPLLLLSGCSSDDNDSPTPNTTQDAAADTAKEVSDDSDDAAIDTTPDAPADVENKDTNGDVASDVTSDAPNDAPEEASLPTMQEQEPNDGTTLDEYNDLPLSTLLSGTIGTVGDADIFRVKTTPGKTYLATLSTPNSELQGNLTVIDTGRNGKQAGDDYVKLANPSGKTTTLAWIAMGEGDHFVVVRDLRNLGSGKVGGPTFSYELVVQEVPISSLQGDELDFALPIKDALQSCGDLKLHRFEGKLGTDVVIALTTSGDMDGRLMIFAETTGSWIARNDNQSAGNKDPKIDAPLTASGPMWLVVENVDHEATSFPYAITSTQP